MAVKLSVVIPTLGRESLAATLASCADADEIVVVLDTARGGTLPCDLPANAVFAEGNFGVTGGHAGRVHGIGLATGTHLAFMDDDDIYTDGAIGLMRAAACDVPVIFRMDHYSHGILWRDREIRFGNVSTQMYVVPNDPSRLGTWEPHVPGLAEPGGDYTFIKETCELMGEPIWRSEVIAEIRPFLVSIVTPWLNHPELLDDYSHALNLGMGGGTYINGRRLEIIEVDNGSDPPLVGARIRLEENVGFTSACNLGLAEAKGDVVIFLNNDIADGDIGWIGRLAEVAKAGVLAGACLRYDRHADVDGQSLPYIDGWCLAGRRDDLLELGGFDESLQEPAYYSDNLLCLRARAIGMSLVEVRTGLRHKVGQSSPESPEKTRAAQANYQRYAQEARELLEGAVA